LLAKNTVDENAYTHSGAIELSFTNENWLPVLRESNDVSASLQFRVTSVSRCKLHRTHGIVRVAQIGYVIGMPLYTVPIDLCCPFRLKAGATFVATLSYPEPDDCILRKRFFRALCRYQVLNRALKERKYALNLQPIMPVIFTDEYATFWSALNKGHEQLKQRLVATSCILLPYLAGIKVDGRDPGINKLSKIAIEALGWRKKSLPTFKDEVWAETRLVAHASAAYLCWQGLSLIVEVDQFLQLFVQEPRMVALVMKAAEQIRVIIPTIKIQEVGKQMTGDKEKPMIEDDEMVEFSAILDNGTLDEFIKSSDN
jgi:hypothetical protein